MSDYLGKDIFKLGFGLMRLPKLADGSMDIPQIKQMVDKFMAAGGTYFDTAYVYDSGASEDAARQALIERYPRDSYTLATKLNAAMQCHDEASAKQQFWTSLERTGAGYFDFYLLHALQRNNYKKYDDYHIWDFVKEQKAKGLIRHWGFSFHADPDLLEELLNAHPDAEFVQLQMNYADWENPGVNSRRCWEICRAHGKPVVVMESVKGGILADPIPEVKTILRAANPDLSPAGWALRFVAGQEGVITALSGMSTLAQMEDNLKTMKDFRPMGEAELAVIREAQEAIRQNRAIPCTACHYCTEGCPMSIPIPEIFAVYNRREGSPHFRTVREYNIVTQDKGKATSCVQCGQCEGACPQHLKIIDLLQECAALMEE